MKKKIRRLASTALILLCALAQPASAAQPGVAGIRFNKRFIPSIKPKMTYEQLVKVVGAPGVKVAENRKTSPPTVHYRWNGGKESVLTVRMQNNRLIDATVLAPNRHTYLIKSNGDIVESP